MNLRVSNPALRYAIIFGLILLVVQVAFSYLSGFLGLGSIGTYVALAIYLLFGLLAGQRASTRTGKLGTGVLSGFLTGLIGSFLVSLLSFILDYVNIDYIRQQFQQASTSQHLGITYTNALVLQVFVISLALEIVLGCLLALAGGAIGGYIGRGRVQLPPPSEYEESMFSPPSSSQSSNGNQ